MSWLAKIAQSKPMPLPFQRPKLKDESDFLQRDPGLNIVDKEMQEETARKLKSRFPSIEYVGSGMNGMAVRLAPGIIGKYTTEFAEAKKYLKIKNHRPECFVQIHSVAQLQEHLWMAIMDELLPVPVIFRPIVEMAFNHEVLAPEMTFNELGVKNWGELRPPRKKISKAQEYYSKARTLAQCLQRNQISVPDSDITASNVGTNPFSGELQVFDF